MPGKGQPLSRKLYYNYKRINQIFLYRNKGLPREHVTTNYKEKLRINIQRSMFSLKPITPIKRSEKIFSN